jgi:hypothetical protein
VYPTQFFDEENKKHCYMDTKEIAEAAVYTENRGLQYRYNIFDRSNEPTRFSFALASLASCQQICQFHQNAKCTFV